MLNFCGYSQDTQEKTRLIVLDGQKVAVVPYASFKAVIYTLVSCDSVIVDSGYNSLISAKKDSLIASLAIGSHLKDTTILNLERIIQNDSLLTRIDKTKIVQLQGELKHERKRFKTLGGISCILIVLALIL